MTAAPGARAEGCGWDVLALGTAGTSQTLNHPQKDGLGLWAHLTKPIHK